MSHLCRQTITILKKVRTRLDNTLKLGCNRESKKWKWIKIRQLKSWQIKKRESKWKGEEVNIWTDSSIEGAMCVFVCLCVASCDWQKQSNEKRERKGMGKKRPLLKAKPGCKSKHWQLKANITQPQSWCAPPLRNFCFCLLKFSFCFDVVVHWIPLNPVMSPFLNVYFCAFICEWFVSAWSFFYYNGNSLLHLWKQINACFGENSIDF